MGDYFSPKYTHFNIFVLFFLILANNNVHRKTEIRQHSAASVSLQYTHKHINIRAHRQTHIHRNPHTHKIIEQSVIFNKMNKKLFVKRYTWK